MTKEPNLYCHGAVPWVNYHAVKLHISKESWLKLGKIPRDEAHSRDGIIAFDQISRKWYAIRHFPCQDSWACYCAAQAVKVAGANSKHIWEPVVFPDSEEEEWQE